MSRAFAAASGADGALITALRNERANRSGSPVQCFYILRMSEVERVPL